MTVNKSNSTVYRSKENVKFLVSFNLFRGLYSNFVLYRNILQWKAFFIERLIFIVFFFVFVVKLKWWNCIESGEIFHYHIIMYPFPIHWNCEWKLLFVSCYSLDIAQFCWLLENCFKFIVIIYASEMINYYFDSSKMIQLNLPASWRAKVMF